MTGQEPATPVDIVAALGRSADTAHPCTWRERAERAEAELATHTAQRAQVRQRVRDGVAAGNFDLGVSNDLLAALGLPPLRRHWTVMLTVSLALPVVSDSADDAFDIARDTIDFIFDQAEVFAEYDVTSAGEAIPGGLADEPDVGPPA